MDCFAALDIPRAPWVDPDLLQRRFHSLSSEWHPDRFTNADEKKSAQQRFSEINHACQTLRSPKSRLGHLLELEQGFKTRHVQDIPPEAMALFPQVAALTRSVDEFFKETSNASPMLRVLQFEKALAWTDQVQDLQNRIAVAVRELESQARGLNSAWHDAPPPGDSERASRLPLQHLQRLAAALGFLEKWNAQLSEKLSRLANV